MRLLTGFALFALASVASAQYEDTIIEKNGNTTQGEVQLETFKGVTLVLEGGKIDYPMDRLKDGGVDAVIFDESSIPPAMANGKRNQAAGSYAAAITQYEKALASAQTRTVLKQHISYAIAECHRLSGDATSALTAYQKLLKDYPESRFLNAVYPSMIECAMTSGRLPEARNVIKDAEKRGKELGFDEGFLGKLKLMDARIHEIEKNTGAALGIYQGLTTNKDPGVAFAAQVGVGRCQILAKEYDKAKSTMERVIRECDKGYPQILIGAYNGLGDYYFMKGDPASLKEALFAYLRGVTLYLPGGNDLTDEHERSICFAARCYKRLGDAETDEKKKEDYLTRHANLSARLRSNFPGSKFYIDLLNK